MKQSKFPLHESIDRRVELPRSAVEEKRRTAMTESSLLNLQGSCEWGRNAIALSLSLSLS